ncbi:DUF3037 domain-containing protein [Rosistilla oblonga]|uniref:DUF3037 domain-containing protein n=1 Tax=Rosistilla oblonga TaxID=2527990 RepID=UPI003A970D60
MIQFCPDTTRLETANLGVALFCAEREFLGTLMSPNNSRIIQMFGRGQRDLKRLKAVKQSLEQTIQKQRDELCDLEQIQKFASLHVNHLRMTRFMPCRIASTPEEELQTLFNELVELQRDEDDKHSPTINRMLDAVFSQQEFSSYIRRDVEVDVPIFRTRDTVPYAYQNGRLNLIKPVEFATRRSSVISKASRNAVEGKSIYENPDEEYGELQLVVVGSFEKTKPSEVETAKRIFEDHQVRLFTTEQIDELTNDIVTHGHKLD